MTTMTSVAPNAHVILTVHCAHCRAEVVLECEGLPAYLGYQTYHEYACPHCRKQNIQRTSGAILSARAVATP